jgi:Chaperone of endosialidase
MALSPGPSVELSMSTTDVLASTVRLGMPSTRMPGLRPQAGRESRIGIEMGANLNASNYILNIIELQNTVTSISGASPFQTLSNTVLQLQQMVQYDTKTIAADRLSAFTNGGTIEVVSPMNFSSVALTENGSTTVVATSVSSIGAVPGRLTVGAPSTPLVFTQSGVSTFQMTPAGDAIFSGTATATAFLTPSDINLKRDVEPIVNYETILSKIRGVHFRWSASGQADVGLVAQELLPVLPQAVVEGVDGLRVSYQKVIPVLVEAVKSLQQRVTQLERSAVAQV